MIPEHFTALVKQLANLVSLEQAEILTKNISECLELTLPTDSSKILFGYAPSYLTVQKRRFYNIRRAQPNNYRHTILLQRLMAEQGLTDDTEAENRIAAYFKAISIVVGNKKYQTIYSILPYELRHLA